jgi:hypothetical protein
MLWAEWAGDPSGRWFSDPITSRYRMQSEHGGPCGQGASDRLEWRRGETGRDQAWLE